jgi:Ca2+-binding RTX toxin-like protein
MMHNRDTEKTRQTIGRGTGIRRRTLLSGTLAGVAGIGLGGIAGTAGAHEDEEDDGRRENEIVVKALTDRAKYRIEVSGSIEAGEEAGEDENDSVSESAVAGLINGKGGVDNYFFSGRITRFLVTKGEVKVYVNGKAVDDPVGFPGAPPRGIVLQALTDRVEYRIEVDDSIEAGREAGEDENDELDDGTVDGLIRGKGGVDNYRFTGSTLTLEITEGRVAFVVGRARGEKNDSDELPNVISVVGTGPAVEYRFVVSGSVEPTDTFEEEETDIPADEITDDGTVIGFVDEGTDDYRYSGAIKVLAEAPVEIAFEFGGDP